MTPIPSPQELGLPAKYQQWRKHQEAAIRAIDESPTPTIALMLPPGAGKSGIYIAWALWRKKRVMILTPSKALQDQLYRDFAGIGLMDLRGQSSYKCEVTGNTVQDAPCHGGYECSIKPSCEYFAKLKRAPHERYLLSNPAFWLYNKAILGEFDALILDEGHSYFEALASFSSISFTKKDAKNYFHQAPRRDWKPWASYQRSLLADQLRRLKDQRVKTDETWEETRILKRLHDRVTALCDADPATLIYQESHRGWTWDVVWPGAYRHLLTCNAKKYVFTSGTMTKRTLLMLGYTTSQFTWAEYPSTFPVERCPVYILPAPALNFHSSKSELRLWQELMDRFMDEWVKYRGLIHTGSYDRAKAIAINSRHGDRIITHSDSRGLPEAIARYLESRNGILVSPAIMEGQDFPYDAARWQVIAKLPFTNPSDPLEAERKRQDPQYPWYTAAQKVQQMRGRVMRVEDDFGVTAICDGAWDAWFFRGNQHHFTSYFKDALRLLNVVPKITEATAAKLASTRANTAQKLNKEIPAKVKKTLDSRVRIGASFAPQHPLFAEQPKTK